MTIADRSHVASRSHVSRRAALRALGSVVALTATHAMAADHAPNDPPPFGTARHQFTTLRPRRLVPVARLVGLDGASTDFAAWRGSVVLLNFWATWCPACRTELPNLERLHALSGEDVRVAAISTDREGRAAVLPYVRALGVKKLAIYLDPDQRLARPADSSTNAPFALYGMPITYVIDRSGCIAGYLAGEADWTSAAARALLDFFRASPAG
jgi:thiol-disulfide isomerase/thioredoxin